MNAAVKMEPKIVRDAEITAIASQQCHIHEVVNEELTERNTEVLIRDYILYDNRGDDLAPANGPTRQKRKGNRTSFVFHRDASHCTKESGHPD